MDLDVFTNPFSLNVFKQKYSMDGQETWRQMCERVVENVCLDMLPVEVKQSIVELMYTRKFIPGGRYLYSAGRPFHQYNNCFLFRAEDSREGWSSLLQKTSSALMTGGGIGVDYSAVRPEGAPIMKTGGKATGPISLMHMVNEVGRHVMQGGQRRSAIWAGLNWSHQDIPKFLSLKDHSADLMKMKDKDLTFPLPMELTNISVIYDTLFFDLVDSGSQYAWNIFMQNCRQAFKSAEPGMSFNYMKDAESLRNACCEVVSQDDSDKCNLGTLWLNRFSSPKELREAAQLATAFLLCGGITSNLPTEKIREVGALNNRIGLGVGGLHEFLLRRGQKYEVTSDLHEYLSAYKLGSEQGAAVWADFLRVNYPVGLRAIAPTGTIGIMAETTTGIEPLFCKAYKRRYFRDSKWQYQYVIDGAVKRLYEQGIPYQRIQDAYDISFEERVKFQADVQDYVDMAISSTCNLPEWGTETNGEHSLLDNAQILYKYAKRLRGFTCYPDGARNGQPLTRVTIETALRHEGTVFEETERECLNGVCGL